MLILLVKVIHFRRFHLKQGFMQFPTKNFNSAQHSEYCHKSFEALLHRMSDQVPTRTTDTGNRLLPSCKDSLAMDIVTNIINFRTLRKAIAIMSLPNQQTRSFPISLCTKYSFSFLFILRYVVLLLNDKSTTISSCK